MPSLRIARITPTAKGAVPMSRSKTSPRSTRAGVALSAQARSRLQRLADWMEEELRSNQDPKIKLSYLGGISVHEGTTHLSPLSALVQIYDPFKQTDAKWLMPGTSRVPQDSALFRVCNILDISPAEYFILLRYVYRDHRFPAVIKALRALK